MTITATVSRSCKSPIATWFPLKNSGSGQPHIICPMEKYMRTTRNMSDAISLLRSFGVSLSTSASCAAFSCSKLLFALSLSDSVAVPFGLAPYPACSTASTICASVALPSTPIELVKRLTEQLVTPSTLETAFSTLAEHAAQLIPVTVYCFILSVFPSFYYSNLTIQKPFLKSLNSCHLEIQSFDGKCDFIIA